MQKKIFILVIIAIVAILSVIVATKPIMLYLYRIEYSEYVDKYAQEYGVDRYLVYALIKNESNFNSDAISNKEAKGLMQIMKETGEELANKLNVENELDNEERNIQLGVFYLAELLQKYDNYFIAIAAYNAGIGNVDKWIDNGIIKNDGSDIEKIPYKETNNYVRKVVRDYNIYKKLYE